jgi:hypothetical protein
MVEANGSPISISRFSDLGAKTKQNLSRLNLKAVFDNKIIGEENLSQKKD